MAGRVIIPQYDIWLGDPVGNRIRQINYFDEITVTLRLNGPNILHLVAPSIVDNKKFPYPLLKEDAWIEAWRGVNNRAKKMLGESPFLLSVYSILDTDMERFKIDGLSASRAAEWPIIAYHAGSDEADKTDFADDMIKEIAAENLGEDATDTDRDMSARLQIQADKGAAPSVSKAFSRRHLAPVFTDICNLSAQEGTRLYWDVVLPMPGNLNNRTLELRTYTGQRGAYRGISLSNPLVFSKGRGNLENINFSVSYEDVVNFAYGLGNDVGASRVVETDSDAARIAKSPWGRIKEGTRQVDSLTEAVVLAEATGLLREKRPKITMTADIVQTPACIFGVHYDHGDVVAVDAPDGKRYEAIISPITISYRRGGPETVRASIRIEAS